MTTTEPRRLAALVAALVLVPGASACGDDEEPTRTVVQTVTAPATTTQSPTEAPTATAPAPTVTETQAEAAAATEPAPAAKPTTRKHAITAARQRFPGERLREVERDDEDGREVWKVELRTRGGAEREVSVAVDGGQIIDVDTDRDD